MARAVRSARVMAARRSFWKESKAMAKERAIVSPTPFPETTPYWEAAARGKLLLRQCNACGDYHFYPRVLCPFCFSDKTEWREAAGTGAIYSFSVTRRAEVPY